ncbi:MAG TPA: exo-beta-N-acetylmuramidase NamZ domain-containing protein [Candidatus Deferrimicrobiaceae bacterium]|nr:exo-beta-N-acetylmuramidase NamZ domain-containing protein [Candidatus Deferrimicrobiaceae bacterium]
MRLRLAVALLMTLVASAPVAVMAQTVTWQQAVDEAVRDAVAASEIPGAVLLVGQGDRILHRKVLGWRATVPKPELMTADTIFDIASLTKVIATAPSVLRLWEMGKLDLNAPLGRYLKEFDSAAFQDVTLMRVLTHSAGLNDLPSREAMAKGFPEAARLQAKAGLAVGPGSTFLYSDTGFILLGEVVRRVSGERLDTFARKQFFAPLGMRDTAFAPPPAWRKRMAPTEVVNNHGPLRGVVHDGNARLLGGVAGHAGVFSTASDLSRFCRMLLAGGQLGGRRYLKEATVRAMFAPHVIGETTRGLGWDIASPYARTLGAYFPIGSVGHTGFTGTAIWMDPATDVYMILLTNRVHPYGKGDVAELRRRVSAAVGARFSPREDPTESIASARTDAAGPAADAAPLLPEGSTLTGLDRLVADDFAPLAGRSVGLITNQTGIDSQGRRAVDLLAAAPQVKLRALFSPEHGITGLVDASVPHSRDAATGLAIWSLYGPGRRPSPEQLNGIDTLVFDIQDVGVRYYTYLTTLVYALEEGGRRRIEVMVLDRPNPITGTVVEGPVMDPDMRSFTAPHAIPVRTGMTIGEFAQMVVAERKLPVRLTVVPLEHWQRSQWFDETGLPWVNPSPNIRSQTQALLYSGVGLLEATNLSVGRGTDMPFEVIGAPWIMDPQILADAMNARGLAGVQFHPIFFTPTSSVHAGRPLGGVRLHVTDRDALRPVAVGLALGQELMERYPGNYRPAAIQNLLVNRSTMWSLLRGDPFARLLAWADYARNTFLQRRASYLIYK